MYSFSQTTSYLSIVKFSGMASYFPVFCANFQAIIKPGLDARAYFYLAVTRRGLPPLRGV